MSTEGAKLSGAFERERVLYMDTTLESPLNGRRRCTDASPYLSGQWTEQEQYDDTFIS